MRTIAWTVAFGVVTISCGWLAACGPEDSFGGAAKMGGSKHGGAPAFAGFGGSGFPIVAQNPMMQRPTAMLAAAQLNQHRQYLALQAAARRERREPIKLARALTLREQKLAERADRRAWVLAKQDERKRKEAEAARQTTPSSPDMGNVLVASYAFSNASSNSSSYSSSLSR